jgi:hypothetical protein
MAWGAEPIDAGNVDLSDRGVEFVAGIIQDLRDPQGSG